MHADRKTMYSCRHTEGKQLKVFLVMTSTPVTSWLFDPWFMMLLRAYSTIAPVFLLLPHFLDPFPSPAPPNDLIPTHPHPTHWAGLERSAGCRQKNKKACHWLLTSAWWAGTAASTKLVPNIPVRQFIGAKKNKEDYILFSWCIESVKHRQILS